MMTMATATARPSRKYLIARVSNSPAENPSMFLYFGCRNIFRGVVLFSFSNPGKIRLRSNLKIQTSGSVDNHVGR
jgi:hypothetical protein